MNEQAFWSLIEQSRARHTSQSAQVAALKALLAKLDAAEVASFDKIFHQLIHKAYTWDLWGAAHILNGGCSDDGFDYFRRGLIAEGQKKFEAALKDVETLVDWAEPDELEFEEITHPAPDVYKEKTGKVLPAHALKAPAEPSGEEWTEESDDLEERFPQLWAKYAA